MNSTVISHTYHNVINSIINPELQFSCFYIPLLFKLSWKNNTFSLLVPDTSWYLTCGVSMGQTLYEDGFQWMCDPQQQSVRVEGQVKRHVPGDGGLGGGKEEMDRGLLWKPGAFLQHKV